MYCAFASMTARASSSSQWLTCSCTVCGRSSEGRMQALEPRIIAGWVQHMRQCAGLSAEPPWHGGDQAPRVLFVNRAVKSGRSVLPMGQACPSQRAPLSLKTYCCSRREEVVWNVSKLGRLKLGQLLRAFLPDCHSWWALYEEAVQGPPHTPSVYVWQLSSHTALLVAYKGCQGMFAADDLCTMGGCAAAPAHMCNQAHPSAGRKRYLGSGSRLLLQVYSHFRQLGASSGASFSLNFLEGMPWRQAAALFDRADIVVSPHGAQTSQALFLPLHSQFLHLDNNAGHAMLTAFVIDVRPPPAAETCSGMAGGSGKHA